MASRPNKTRLSQRHRRILVSACLAGIDCTYKAKNNLDCSIRELVDEGVALPVCPEVMGGLGVPRENAEIAGGDGADVIKKKARVMTASGKDVSKIYIAGAKKVLAAAKRYSIKSAVLKSDSPACGKGMIYDGTFTRRLKKGNGVLAALLIGAGIKVFTRSGKSGKI